ncbi:sugar isomerase [Enterococcus sp. JM4C]|uniref:MurR/RpiR family transcriptional regulator n=1 Tax=Candidatus Enterococcus huntleyi TaxID=1857217 RepID=UPI001379D98B|nr:MurR/RpiR family transcriptional regulator [Enterococcus sp. JM4C]KAF1296737.1 sugar isomerase [Enterococcus sp. JM4C]
MLIKEQLETYPFSQAESVTVAFLLEHPERLEAMTIQEIAAETFTQSSTLVRISKKLQFAGWKDLKQAYLEEWQYLSKNFTKIDANLPFLPTDSTMNIINKLAVLEKSTIDDIVSLLHHDSLSAAKRLLLNAEVIRVFSQNANLLIAQDFALKMNRIRRTVVLSSLKGEERYEAYNVPRNGCAILISYSGENKDILKINQILKSRNVPTIAITSIGDNSLSKECTCFLPVTTREKLYSKIGNFTTNMSIIFLLDALYSIVFAENYEKNLEHLKRVGQLVDKRKIAVDVMREE